MTQQVGPVLCITSQVQVSASTWYFSLAAYCLPCTVSVCSIILSICPLQRPLADVEGQNRKKASHKKGEVVRYFHTRLWTLLFIIVKLMKLVFYFDCSYPNSTSYLIITSSSSLHGVYFYFFTKGLIVNICSQSGQLRERLLLCFWTNF